MLVGSWNWVCFVLGLMALSIGVSVLAVGEFSGNEFTVVLSLGLGGWVSATAPFAGARVDERGIHYRGIFKRTRLSWGEVQSILVEPLGGSGLLEAEMPVVKKADGKDLPILVLAGYTSGRPRTNGRVRRQVTVMCEALDRAHRR
ncbi:hypothetical protein ACF09C_36930 [Streptomyces sp. NPDC014870]|uniref:hypothetical protein n=1 Tax=Streptomyces sp. NPDC014870 TaxID=3364925 RepID=UPI003700A3E8